MSSMIPTNDITATLITISDYNESTGVQNPRRPITAINMQDTSGGGVSLTALSKIMYASAVYNVH